MIYPTQQEIVRLHNEQYNRVAGKKAGDTYTNEDGVTFAILSARKNGGYRKYTSYTHDVQNVAASTHGTLAGRKVGWEHITIKE